MSTQRFHLDKNGHAATCSATQRACPLGDEHYGSYEDAVKASVYKELGQEAKAAALVVTPPPTQGWKDGEIAVEALPAAFKPEVASGYGRGSREAAVVTPAGTYYLGDPCYVLGSLGPESNGYETWDKLCETMDFDAEIRGAMVNGHPVVMTSTAYGDGTYESTSGKSYPVDSGQLGLVPKELVFKLGKLEEAASSGSWVTVAHPSTFSYSGSEEGSVSFGSEVIPTDPHDNYCENCGREISEEQKDYGGVCEDCETNYCESCGTEIDTGNWLCDDCASAEEE